MTATVKRRATAMIVGGVVFSVVVVLLDVQVLSAALAMLGMSVTGNGLAILFHGRRRSSADAGGTRL